MLLRMWICPRCAKEYPDATTCACGYDGAPLEAPAVLGIFSSGPAINEDRDRKRRNSGLGIIALDAALIAIFWKAANGSERISQGIAEGIIGAGAVYWIARKADRGDGLALLIGAVALLLILLVAGGVALVAPK